MAEAAPVLLTGSTGFIGGRLLYALDEQGATVRCLVRRGETFKAPTAAVLSDGGEK